MNSALETCLRDGEEKPSRLEGIAKPTPKFGSIPDSDPDRKIPTPRDLLALGCYLFPVAKKRPLVPWTKQSSNDPEQIQRWESMPGRTGFAIDCGRSNLAVIDIDSGKVPGADIALQSLEFEYGELPKTLTVRTPSGGYHRIYSGKIKNTASKLGKGLDTRGSGGYIVAPGSPGYTVECDGPITPVPGWLVERVGRPAERPEQPPVPDNVALDSETAIKFATQFLTHAEPAIEGLGGDLHTYKVACGVRDYGVSAEMALELMLEHWNDSCCPPWTPEELQTKIRNAYSYAEKPLGAQNPENVFTPFEDAAPQSAKAVKSLFIDVHQLIRQELTINYIIQDLIETPTTGLIFGDPGSGKSFLALAMALAIAYGTEWMGSMAGQGGVLYFNGEGHVGAARRIKAWMKHYGKEDIPKGVFSISQRRIDINERSVKRLEPRIEAHIDKYGPLSLIVIDTLSRHLPADADENSAKDVNAFINAVDYLKNRFQCVVMVIHHSGKSNKNESRGSSAIKGALDWEFRVAPGEIHFTKQKEGELPAPMGFDLVTVDLGNGITSAVSVACTYDPSNGKMPRMTTRELMALDSLKMAISQSGGAAVARGEWKKVFYVQFGSDGTKAARRMAFNRASKKLLESGVAEPKDGKISLVAGNESN